jgi:hypothetical protein
VKGIAANRSRPAASRFCRLARHCIPGETGPACVAARGDWPLAAVPHPASACDTCVHAFYSAWDVRPRSAAARSLARSTPRPSAITGPAANAREAYGASLSMRMACGKPCSRKAASKMACTPAASVFSTAWQRNRYRVCASEMVSGSLRWPSAVRNQPLKSAHHAWLALSACANGSQ